MVAGEVFWRIWADAPVDTSGQHAFQNRLEIPPLEEGRVDQEGRRVFDLKVLEGRTELIRGRRRRRGE